MEIKLLSLPKISDPRGNLTFLENDNQIPFKIKRVFWTYDVPGGEIRGGHAYYSQQELIIALSGSFDVITINKFGEKKVFSLNRSYNALFLPQLTWRHIENFSSNSLSLHVSDSEFNESDYIRDYQNFLDLIKG